MGALPVDFGPGCPPRLLFSLDPIFEFKVELSFFALSGLADPIRFTLSLARYFEVLAG